MNTRRREFLQRGPAFAAATLASSASQGYMAVHSQRVDTHRDLTSLRAEFLSDEERLVVGFQIYDAIYAHCSGSPRQEAEGGWKTPTVR